MLKKLLVYFSSSILSGLLLAFSWPEIGDQEWMIFFAFIPILFLERKLSKENIRFKSGAVFTFSYITFITFNWITTWWIKLASEEGMIMAVAFNSIFMSALFVLFHITRRNINDKVGYVALVFFWVGFEYLHINWELSWIWLTLGNVFANRIEWIQWYEYTGTLGGSLWVLSINAMLFFFLFVSKRREISKRIFSVRITLFFLVLLAPFIISKVLFNTYEEIDDPVEIVLIQPNIDPYNDKFNGMTEYEQIDRLIGLSGKNITPNTDLVFAPETAFPLSYWEDEIRRMYGYKKVKDLIQKYPHIKYVVGLSTIKLYTKPEDVTITARSMNDGTGNYYDFYNSVMQIEGNDRIQIYRKSQLVLGVERMPFVSNFAFMKKLTFDLGGATGSLGIEMNPKTFNSKSIDGRKIRVIPAICYESIYGEYLTEFVKKGGNLLGIVTNDGWWGSTPGYKQHLAYSKLRAIELRRSVARSANTGISAFINQKGEILQQSEWWTQDALRGNLNLNDKVTFYAAYGDYIGRIAAFFAVLLFVWMMVNGIMKKQATP